MDERIVAVCGGIGPFRHERLIFHNEASASTVGNFKGFDKNSNYWRYAILDLEQRPTILETCLWMPQDKTVVDIIQTAGIIQKYEDIEQAGSTALRLLKPVVVGCCLLVQYHAWLTLRQAPGYVPADIAGHCVSLSQPVGLACSGDDPEHTINPGARS
ncbi:hypothetical protein CBL_05264 [Carabus blaptoides fortunei]